MIARERRTRVVDLQKIESADGPRPIDEGAVERLAASMSQIGMHTPIVVESAGTDARGDNLYRVVSGRHRVAAARKLGWPAIEAMTFEDHPAFDGMEDADFDALAEMWAIAENLHRADLSKEQRDQQIRRYAELLRERCGGGKPCQIVSLSDVGGRGNVGVARKIAEQTGVKLRTVQRILAPKPAEIPAPKDWGDVEAEQKRKLMHVWNGCCPAVQEWFRATIDRPVMDARWST